MRESAKKQLISELLKMSETEFDDEELLHKLLDRRMTGNANDSSEKLTSSQKAADNIARFTGSWTFIIVFVLVLVSWMILNIRLAEHSFDAYPFILLNLVLSCVAAIQAPLIMMSQNRQEAKDRSRSENDYRVNLKNELVIDDLHYKIDDLLSAQEQIMKRPDSLERQIEEGRVKK